MTMSLATAALPQQQQLTTMAPQLVTSSSSMQQHHSLAGRDSPAFPLPGTESNLLLNTSTEATTDGVTPTSSVQPPSFVSIRPLPSPGIFVMPPLEQQPSPEPPLQLPRAVSISSSSVEMKQSSAAYHPVPSSASSTCSTSSASLLLPVDQPLDEPQLCPKSENSGRWSAHEHKVFLQGLDQHGKAWKKIAGMIRTRSVVQVRTHAQKYFQKLSKTSKKEGSAVMSTSTSSSVAPMATGVCSSSSKRKSPSKSKSTAKRRKAPLEPRPRQPRLLQQQPLPAPLLSLSDNANMIDPNFMNTLNMSMGNTLDGDIDDSILDLLDDTSSVDAMEQVMGDDMEPNPVTPSVSSVSLDGSVIPPPQQSVINDLVVVVQPTPPRQELVISPKPEDFSIHNRIGTASGAEMSPTSVTNLMEFQDLEQHKTNPPSQACYVDPLDWLVDVGVYQLPAAATEKEEWTSTTTGTGKNTVSVTQLEQINWSALSVLDNDVF